MKKFTVSALCCVAACALCLGGCNKNADTSGSCAATCADKAACAEKAGCCKGKAEGDASCCKAKKAAEQN